jgi:hypothetical protein
MEASRRLLEPRPALGSAERAIARTVLYAALFDYPLTLAQLRQTLLEQTMTASEILRVYRASVALREVVAFEDGFFLPRGRSDLVSERRRREARSRRFLERHRRLIALICAMPYVRMVALSGSVAHLNMDGRGDLDLFIVTRGRRVWMVTVAVLVLAKLLRRRSRLCANFVVSDDRLTFEDEDLFTASQIVNLKPLVGSALFTEILSKNRFVSRCYPNFHASGSHLPGVRRPHDLGRVKTVFEDLLRAPTAAGEFLCRHAYRAYLRRKASTWESPDGVRLEDDYLKLHTHSHRRRVTERFARAASEIERD